MHEELTLYTDGGIIGMNPSKVGGTWSYCQVDPRNSTLVALEGGVLTPDDVDLPEVTNNVTELWAALEGLANMPRGWAGTWYTDSQVTLWRLTKRKSFEKTKGLTRLLYERVSDVLRHVGPFRAVLLGGHPTRQDLERGFQFRDRHKTKTLPVSAWNVKCDQHCTWLGDQYVQALKREEALP